VNYPYSVEDLLPEFNSKSIELNSHEYFMNRCLELAFQGSGWAQPNPLVGSVIVHNQQIIAEGYHRKFGENHAERMAILSLENKDILKDCTLYVSLEPCSHFGKTPPCSDLIIEYQIPKVVVGMLDPNPIVNGNGIKRLKEHGIEVVENLLTDSCSYLNRKFIINQTQKRPFITLKWAESKDGFYAPIPKKLQKITGSTAQKFTHRLRQSHQAILVGIGTWKLDQPQLNDRYFGGPQPVKLVMTENELWCFTESLKWTGMSTCIQDVVKGESELNRHTEISDELENSTNGVHSALKCYKIPFKGVEFESLNFTKAEYISEFCYQNGWYSLLVEGGSSVWNAFLDQNLVDELIVYRSQTVELGVGIRVPKITMNDKFQTPITVDLDEYEKNLELSKYSSSSVSIGVESRSFIDTPPSQFHSDQLILFKWKK
jgi:diaminohydroxyphosphoribosylaminopyrimidine deaminase / 5-amino-6-(5-phosphoribosylamino)uracil reductase